MFTVENNNSLIGNYVAKESKLKELCSELRASPLAKPIQSLTDCITATEKTMTFFNFVKATYSQILKKENTWNSLLKGDGKYASTTTGRVETVTEPNSFSHIYNIEGSFYGLDPVKTGVLDVFTSEASKDSKNFDALNNHKLVLPPQGQTRPDFTTVLSVVNSSLMNMIKFLEAYITLFSTFKEVGDKPDNPKYETLSNVLDKINAAASPPPGSPASHLTIDILVDAVNELQGSPTLEVAGGAIEEQETVLQALQNKSQQLQKLKKKQPQ